LEIGTNIEIIRYKITIFIMKLIVIYFETFHLKSVLICFSKESSNIKML
jgi:hypothetical protein